METHALGGGSKLTKELHRLGIGWRLAAVYEASAPKMRAGERMLKNTHNVARYCPICSGAATAMLPGMIFREPETLGIPLTSAEIRSTRVIVPPADLEIWRAESEKEKAFMLHWMNRERNALGFIPIPKEGPLTATPLIIGSKGEPFGYALLSVASLDEQDTVKIQQLLIKDTERLNGYGRHLLTQIAATYPEHRITCKVRQDLTANEFWLASGFMKTGTFVHETSHNRLNCYELKREEK